MCTEPFLRDIAQRFRTDKSMAERAMAQLTDEEFFRRPAAGFNSVANIVRHVAGNLISRWTDFLTTDGEKPDRDRESEFADWAGSRAELLAYFDRAFGVLFATLQSLSDDDLKRTVTIRTEPIAVTDAIVRSMAHFAYHVGQILYVSRLVHSGAWKYLTIAPGASNQFNDQMRR